jgi:hypothetical protein
MHRSTDIRVTFAPNELVTHLEEDDDDTPWWESPLCSYEEVKLDQIQLE